MRALPEDLEAMPEPELSEQGAMRDEQLAPLFRRWPDLSRFELRQLRRMYSERVRIAKSLGRRGTRDE